jgi:hypothetical protein
MSSLSLGIVTEFMVNVADFKSAYGCDVILGCDGRLAGEVHVRIHYRSMRALL